MTNWDNCLKRIQSKYVVFEKKIIDGEEVERVVRDDFNNPIKFEEETIAEEFGLQHCDLGYRLMEVN